MINVYGFRRNQSKITLLKAIFRVPQRIRFPTLEVRKHISLAFFVVPSTPHLRVIFYKLLDESLKQYFSHFQSYNFYARLEKKWLQEKCFNNRLVKFNSQIKKQRQYFSHSFQNSGVTQSALPQGLKNYLSHLRYLRYSQGNLFFLCSKYCIVLTSGKVPTALAQLYHSLPTIPSTDLFLFFDSSEVMFLYWKVQTRSWD